MLGDSPLILPSGGIFHGRYRVVRCIKAGGMGAVYEVVHLETKRRRALKVMLPAIVASPEMRSRFKLEATVAADIESEHIVETFDAGVDVETGSPFLVMELLRGHDLSQLVDRGPLGAQDTVRYLTQAALALDKTHAAGVVHRDLKPENLFVSHRDDGSPRLKILDFGIAKVVSMSAQTAKQTATIGTPLYMSPEQIQGDGKIGPRADLYAVGHIAYTLLSGEAYWAEEARVATNVYGLLMKVVVGPTEAPSARAWRRGIRLPVAFDAWFGRATAIVPQQRFERASEQVAALAEALGARPSHGNQPSAPPKPAFAPSAGTQLISGTPPGGRTTGPVSSEALTPAKRSAMPFVLGAFGVLALGGAALVAAFRLGSSGEPTTTPAAMPADATATATEPAPAPEAASVTPAVPAAAPEATAPRPGAPVKPPRKPAAAQKCDPPYEIGVDGHRHIKKECR